MQALSIKDDSIQIQFIHLTTLCHSIGNLLRNNMALIPHKRHPIYVEYTPPRFTLYKNKNQLLEEVVENKLSKKSYAIHEIAVTCLFQTFPKRFWNNEKRKES